VEIVWKCNTALKMCYSLLWNEGLNVTVLEMFKKTVDVTCITEEIIMLV
jgi:hypothetical protein